MEQQHWSAMVCGNILNLITIKDNLEVIPMKHLLSLLLISSFACAMEPDEVPAPKEQNIIELLEQKDHSKVTSLRTLCTNKISKMSLKEFLQSNQPKLPRELDSLVGSQIIKQTPLINATILKRITISCLQTSTGHAKSIASVAISPDGTKLVTGSKDSTAKIWDMSSGQCLQTLTTGHTDYISSVAISPDGTKVFTGSWDNTAKIWGISSGQCLHTFTGHTDHISSVAISPDGTKLVTCSGDGTAKVWDATKFNILFNYLHNTSIKQALLLKAWHAAQQNNRSLDLSNPEVQTVFDSLPDEIQKNINPENTE